MFPAKAHGPTVFDFNSVGIDAACCHQAKDTMALATAAGGAEAPPVLASVDPESRRSIPTF